MKRINLGIFRVVEKLKSKGIDEVFLYGAGRLGQNVLNYCVSEKIKVLGFIDQKAMSGSYEFLGYNVITVENFNLAKGAIIVCSEGYIEQIEQSLIKSIGSSNDNVEIFFLHSTLNTDIDAINMIYNYPDSIAAWKCFLKESEVKFLESDIQSLIKALEE